MKLSNDKPLVSIVIPVRDGAAFLTAAINSVNAQSEVTSEIIVVDDGSGDGSSDLARSFDKVRVVTLAPRGQSAARNAGAGEARGSFLAFLDADDLWANQRLAIQLRAFERRPELDIAFAHALTFREIDPHGQPALIGRPIAAHLPGAMLVRRETFWRVGPYSDAFRVGEPLEWYSRAIDLGLVIETLPDVLLYRRLHADNLGRKIEQTGKIYSRLLRSIIERRRSGEPSQ